MFMQQRLGLKLAQKPVLTQSLRQLVKLLALNKLELKEEINQELVENPVLEQATDDGREESLDEAVAKETEREEATDQSSDDSADAFSDIDLSAFFDDYLDPGPRSPVQEVVDKPSFETFLSKPTTLTDHLLWQLSMSAIATPVLAAAEAIVGNLNEDGYLMTDLDEIGAESGSSQADVERALEIVQQLDPLGVGAQGLQDCLLIQLRAEEAENGVAGAIVRECWQQLQNGANSRRRSPKRSIRPEEHIEIALNVIAALDPRPGQRYDSSGDPRGGTGRAVREDAGRFPGGAQRRRHARPEAQPQLPGATQARGLVHRGARLHP